MGILEIAFSILVISIAVALLVFAVAIFISEYPRNNVKSEPKEMRKNKKKLKGLEEEQCLKK